MTIDMLGMLSILCSILKNKEPPKDAAKLIRRMRKIGLRVQGNRGAIPVTWPDLKLILEGSLKDCLKFLAKGNSDEE